MKYRITKIYRDAGLEGGFRTDAIEGEALSAPEIGKSFFMYGEPLAAGDIRVVATSAVQKIEPIESGVKIHTLSGSIYSVEEVK